MTFEFARLEQAARGLGNVVLGQILIAEISGVVRSQRLALVVCECGTLLGTEIAYNQKFSE